MQSITEQARLAVTELIERARLTAGQILVVGCSTSEIGGHSLGTSSAPEIGRAVLDGILPETDARGIFLAAQCCEHLNRALILGREAMERYGLEQVNAVPQTKAGGSFAAALYGALGQPVAVESIRAHAGLDIGGVLIGMHLRAVAVPLRLAVKRIGEAPVSAARTRPKYVGGERAVYDPNL